MPSSATSNLQDRHPILHAVRVHYFSKTVPHWFGIPPRICTMYYYLHIAPGLSDDTYFLWRMLLIVLHRFSRIFHSQFLETPFPLLWAPIYLSKVCDSKFPLFVILNYLLLYTISGLSWGEWEAVGCFFPKLNWRIVIVERREKRENKRNSTGEIFFIEFVFWHGFTDRFSTTFLSIF